MYCSPERYVGTVPYELSTMHLNRFKRTCNSYGQPQGNNADLSMVVKKCLLYDSSMYMYMYVDVQESSGYNNEYASSLKTQQQPMTNTQLKSLI
jgi:hypothetical protein